MSITDPDSRSRPRCPKHHKQEDEVSSPEADAADMLQQKLRNEVGAQVRTVVDRLFWEMFRTREGKEHE
ncbi:MAG: hypothetical protein K1Y02_22815 [Candidatus Hydrogenedentes bacterium]|nr:hypothetical protein [Candidatus Hydrogenedentota bacterium]